MSPHIVAILVLAGIFVLGTTRSVNLGVLALVGAFVVGVWTFAVDAADVLDGFPANLFVILVGVTYLFAMAKRNGTVDWLVIELAQLESTINAIGPAVVGAAYGETVRPAGNDDEAAAPHGVYPCVGEDTWCAVAVFDDHQWAATRRVLSGVDWSRHPQFDSAEGRRHARADLDRLIARASARWDADRLATELAACGVAASAVLHADDLVRRDPQLRARRHWVTLDHPVMGSSIYDRSPYQFSATPGCLRTPAPLLGADSRDVCTELLGLSDETYETLEQQGVVG